MNFLSTGANAYSAYDTFFGEDTGLPSIGGITADLSSLNDIVTGHGDSQDYGRGIGAGVGAFFGQPQLGATVGSKVLPVLNDVFHNIWDSIK